MKGRLNFNEATKKQLELRRINNEDMLNLRNIKKYSKKIEKIDEIIEERVLKKLKTINIWKSIMKIEDQKKVNIKMKSLKYMNSAILSPDLEVVSSNPFKI